MASTMTWEHKTTGKDHGKPLDYWFPVPTSFEAIVEAIADETNNSPDGFDFDAGVALQMFKRGAGIFCRAKSCKAGPKDEELDATMVELRESDPDRLVAAQATGLSGLRKVLVARYYELADE